MPPAEIIHEHLAKAKDCGANAKKRRQKMSVPANPIRPMPTQMHDDSKTTNKPVAPAQPKVDAVNSRLGTIKVS